MNGKKKLSEKKIPHIATKLRDHIVTVPHEILAASGIVIMGRRIKSLIFSTTRLRRSKSSRTRLYQHPVCLYSAALAAGQRPAHVW